jgi:hypothetical protein
MPDIVVIVDRFHGQHSISSRQIMHDVRLQMAHPSVQNAFSLLRFSGLCPETHSLFVKREAKTLIRSV